MYHFDLIGLDTFTLGKGTISNGFLSVLIIVDYATSFVFLEPLVEATAVAVMEKLHSIFATVGGPLEIHVDGGCEFINNLFQDYTCEQSIKVTVLPPNYHESNGCVEAHVKIVKQVIKTCLNGEISCWSKFVKDAQFSVNTCVTAWHRSTPFSLMFACYLNISGVDRDLTN